MDFLRRQKALRAAAQDHGIAGLEAERAGVGGNGRAAFINDADHAERRRDPLDDEAIGALEPREYAPDGIGQGRDFLQALGRGFDLLGVEAKSVEESARVALGRCGRDVACIGREDGVLAFANRGRGRADGAVLGFGRGERQRMRGFSRGAAEFGHDRGDIVVAGLHVFHRLPKRGLHDALIARHDHVVAMDDRGPAGRAEQNLYVLRIAPEDQDGLACVIGDEAAADLAALGVADHDAVAASEIALDADHAGGQQALAVA